MQHPRPDEVSTPHWDALDGFPPVIQPDHAVAGVLVPLYLDDQESVRVIMTKRPDNMRTHPGDVVFPGGRFEPGESAVEAAIREACEEVALPPNAIHVVGGLTPLTTRDPRNLIVPVVARVRRPDVLVPQPDEVELILEPTIDELLDDTRWQVSEWFGNNLWFYDFPDATLWGATAFMVRELLEYFRPASLASS
jgi:8-oxo-dGTP pyrophosphatase MutT (NUDIX family)